MTYDPVPVGSIDSPGPDGSPTTQQQQAELIATLKEAGVKPGSHDASVATWLTTTWEWNTVATIASWIKRANQTL
ncbi:MULTISPECIES: hypothetical protein [unclassified Streptomyces]|uniref:hypothetical protein n=1 Tax=unclassified Streptomyces TaxID=2593676 RepID=UPI00288A9C21|nr:hypothetical protein [Streptomyces sp. ITFR-6]WNI34620.1 hypothetical protein RLT59_39190 [Streptomyces sp. ITFR-6]